MGLHTNAAGSTIGFRERAHKLLHCSRWLRGRVKRSGALRGNLAS